MDGLTIKDGKLVDPAAGTIKVCDVHVRDGLIDENPGRRASRIDAKNRYVAPGIIDMGCFAIDIPAFVAGGITRAALMPDQHPVLDEAAIVERASNAGKPQVWIHPIAAATRGLEGTELAEMGLMQRSGAVAVSTGRKRIADSGVMHKVLSYAAALDLIVITHAEDEGLSGHATATDGETATRLGLSSAPAISEAISIARDVMLAADTGGHVHFREVTTARGFEMIREAKKTGVKVSCGISPAYLLLSDVDIGAYRTFAKLSPPLRSPEDRKAALSALSDGTIDVICSGHDPQGPEAKRLPFSDAEPGVSGAETLLALSLNLVREGHLDLANLFTLLSANPAKLLGIPGGSVNIGAPADLIVFDAGSPWKIDSSAMVSGAGNTPFDGIPVQGKVVETIKGGRSLDRPPV
jgi:dihydroorotase